MTDRAAQLEMVALYWGCIGRVGHFLHDRRGRMIYDERPLQGEGFPWGPALMDGGLLKNGKHDDKEDGRVFWTCGGRPALWFAFFWWDNSVDRRGASNSGFYVRGFEFPQAPEAFAFACEAFPQVVARQRHPLVLQKPPGSLPIGEAGTKEINQ